MAIFGIDVSHWQGNIDWNKVKADGVKFAILKAGGSDGKTNPFYKDAKFEEYYKGAKSVGLDVGCYYFVGKNFVSKADGIADAERFAKLIAGKQFEYPICLDIEITPFDKKAGATDACIAFCEYLENKGYYVSIYASDISGFKDRLDIDRLTKFDKWVARYGSEPQYVKEYGMWQSSSAGKISGINGNVDTDGAYKDYPHIIKVNGLNGFAKAKPQPPKPQPKPYVVYVVKTGDTLSSIAKKYGTTWKKIAEYNGIKNPDLIYADQRIKIPK